MPTETFKGLHLASGVRGLLGYCASLGLDVGRIVQEAGLPLDRPGGGCAHLPRSARLALWNAAMAASGDPHLHLHVVEHAPFAAFLADLICASSRSVHEAFREQCVAIHRFDVSIDLSFEQTDQGPFLLLGSRDGRTRSRRREAEHVFAVCCLRLSRAMRIAIKPVRVEFAMPEPADGIAEVERVFGCRVHYGCDANRLWLAEQDLGRVNRSHRPELLAWMQEEILSATQAQALDAVLSQVEALLREQMGGDLPSVGRVAKNLGMSQRSLQRRLAESGTNFSGVLSRVRERVARELILEQSLSLAEISNHLGYSDHSAFSRAFKRWTGAAPSAYGRASLG